MSRRTLIVSFLCGGLAFAAALPFVTAAGAWEKVRQTSDGVGVFLREAEGASVKEVKASVVVQARPLTVLDAACDPRTFRKSLDYVEANRFILTDNRNIWFNYQRLSLPVISKRDYTLRYERTVNAEKKLYHLSFRTVTNKGPSPIEDVIRVALAKGGSRRFLSTAGSAVGSTTTCSPIRAAACPGGSSTWRIE